MSMSSLSINFHPPKDFPSEEAIAKMSPEEREQLSAQLCAHFHICLEQVFDVLSNGCIADSLPHALSLRLEVATDCVPDIERAIKEEQQLGEITPMDIAQDDHIVKGGEG